MSAKVSRNSSRHLCLFLFMNSLLILLNIPRVLVGNVVGLRSPGTHQSR